MRAEDLQTDSLPRIEPVRNGIPRPVEAIVVSICIVVTLPLLALLLLLIALSSRGPVIFRQLRVGRGGRVFELYKLRTMLCVSEGLQVTAADDERVTRLGRFLRQTRLDMLPELWNIFKGDMSFVGPRPEVPRYVDLNNRMWVEVLKIRPGLTDPVTILMRNEEELLAMVKGDRERFYLEQLQPYKIAGQLKYLKQRSWTTDLRVLWDTSLSFVGRRKTQVPLFGNGSEYRMSSLPDEIV